MLVAMKWQPAFSEMHSVAYCGERGGGGLIVAERMRVQGRRMLMVVVVEEEEEVVKRLLFGPGLKPEAIR